ncbi:NlpC/P60 family protein [Neobacillus sp. FSL H8-0543]|uniref:C40 family peptidase n=1 Tax=Neobacillus sp. FSL H8-0543 TaxID=2954672 RepID=UPI003157F684
MKKLIFSGLLTCSLLLSGLIAEQKTEAASIGETVSNVALSVKGVPYSWGGTTTSGFDCSGLVNYAYKQAGVSLPRTSADLYNYGQVVSKGNLTEGDLVFFSTYKAGPSHVGIYLSDNQFIHASNSGVTVDSLTSRYWSGAYYGAKRVYTQTGWVKSNSTWYYYNQGEMKTGWLYTGGKWYYLASDGSMKTNWVKVNGSWYFLTANGDMKTGWVYVNNEWYYLAGNGAMKTGWIWSNNKSYYLKSDGSMAKDTIIDGYVVGSDGAWIQ